MSRQVRKSQAEIKEHFDKLEAALRPGVFYEDCKYHPMVCVGVNLRKDTLMGISLVDGVVSACSIRHCGVRIISGKEAVRNCVYGLHPRLRDDLLSFNWVHENDKDTFLQQREKDVSEGKYFPAANPKTVEFVESGVGKKLRRR